MESHGNPAEQRRDAIALAAYSRAAQRGFEPGYELDDWLAAEREIDSLAAVARGIPAAPLRAAEVGAG
jgi:hypothetical protein